VVFVKRLEMDLIRFLFEVLTNLFFIPALFPLSEQKRHFPFFVGITQVFASLFYCMSDYFSTNIFITRMNWHFISDVLTLTYVLLIFIHLTANPDEEFNLILRYLAFFLSWIFKYRDEWVSSWFFLTLLVLICAEISAAKGCWKHLKFQRNQNWGKVFVFSVCLPRVVDDQTLEDEHTCVNYFIATWVLSLDD
jgi:hypothetical protein